MRAGRGSDRGPGRRGADPRTPEDGRRAMTTAAEDRAGDIEALRFAAEDGHPESMFLLGIAHAQGQGVARDDVAAARWFHRAAKKGHARARTSLAFLYSIGRGVRQDAVLAYVFLARSTAEGDRVAADMLFKLRQRMHPAQVREAERRTAAPKIA